MKNFKLRWLLGICFLCGFIGVGANGFAAVSDDVERPSGKKEKLVPDQYIVVLKDEKVPHEEAAVDRVGEEIAARAGGQKGHTYSKALKGFVIRLPEGADPSRLLQDPRVEFVQQDRIAYALDHVPSEIPTGIDRVNAELNPSTVPASAGWGVAVIDTGIQLDHPELNVVGNVSFVKGAKSGKDDNGHGTHVAGTVGARDNGIGVVGIAPGAPLYAVKVLNRNGSGFWSDIIKGIDWVTSNRAKIAVANMSLGGYSPNADDGDCGYTNGDALHRAICRSVAAGVVYVVAAGNSTADAKDFAPAAYDEVITVSALADSDGKPDGVGSATSYGADDTFATFSNFGPDVDIIAPGVNILSTTIGSAYRRLSGTSMAAPHVTGTVALWVARNGRPATGDAKDPAVRKIVNEISEAIGSFRGDPDGIAERTLNADTTATGGTGSSVAGPAP